MVSKNERKYKKDIVIFTGQSGIKTEDCIKKLRDNDFGKDVEVINLENKMIEIYSGKPISSLKDKEKRKTFNNILNETRIKQKRLWNDSLSKVIGEASQKENKLYLLNFHATFFHQKTKEFISPIDLLELGKLKNRVKMVIVLIDDCYDIYIRLLRKEQMFYKDIFKEEVSKEKAEESEEKAFIKAFIKSVWNIHTILTWRDLEIAFSWKIVDILKLREPLFVVAVKHPIKIFKRLVFFPLDKLKIYYLAHPIKSAREEERDKFSGFISELLYFEKSCMDLKSNISIDKNFVVFIPDMIDELRIKKENGEYVPELAERWLLPYLHGVVGENAPLSVPLKEEEEKRNPLNPKGILGESFKQAQMCSYPLRILSEKIKEHIASRDYALVEQSRDGVIAFQPYYPDELSGGARLEMAYNKVLSEERGDWYSNRKNYVIDKQENVARYRIKHLFTLLKQSIINVENSVNVNEELDKIMHNWFRDIKVVKGFGTKKYELFDLCDKFEEEFAHEYDFSADIVETSSGSTLVEHGLTIDFKNKDEGWEKIYNIVMKKDVLKSENLPDEYIVASSDDYLDKVEELKTKLIS